VFLIAVVDNMNDTLKKKISSLLAFVMIFTAALSNVFTVNAESLFSSLVNDSVVTGSSVNFDDNTDEYETQVSEEEIQDTDDKDISISEEEIQDTGDKDNSVSNYSTELFSSEFGKTYVYDFAVGDVVSSSAIKIDKISSEDEVITIDATKASNKFYWHDKTHGIALYGGTNFLVNVPGNSRISFYGCEYGSGTINASSSQGTITPESADFKTTNDGEEISFEYEGPAAVLTFAIAGTGESYLHKMQVVNFAQIPESNGKIDVWDFGAYQFDTEKYNNILTEDVINNWYEGVAPGTGGTTLPKEIVAGNLTIVGTGNDRLRTKNTNLTRFDENAGETKKGISSEENITGSLYFNGTNGQSIIKYLSIPLAEDDEITIVARCDNANGIEFLNAERPELQRDYADIDSNGGIHKFVAKTANTYKIFSAEGTNAKGVFYRIYREDAKYVDIKGSITAPDTLNNYQLIFTNDYTGKEFTADISNGQYSVRLPGGYDYTLSLGNANGYIISSDLKINVPKENDTVNNDVKIISVELYKVTGEIKGFAENYDLSKLDLAFNAKEDRIYVPEVKLTGTKYETQLEPNIKYIVDIKGVNDYAAVSGNEITIEKKDTVNDITMKAKTLYSVNLNLSGIDEQAKKDLIITFSNLNEEGYSYSFKGTETPKLRDGVYTVEVTGLDAYQYEAKVISNVKIDGADVNKTIEFVSGVNEWDFSKMTDAQAKNGKFSGLQFEGANKNKSYLLASAGNTIKIPAKPNDKITVQYCYSANFNFDGGEAIVSNSGSTSTHETAEYVYTGTEAGYVTINVLDTTYFEKMSALENIEYKETVTVGADKDYKTINEALDAIKLMKRTDEQRVTIMIDPGNYEEMLVIDEDNITLTNANGVDSSIELINKGVDIAEGAVRITSYYGHGVSYYSMGSDCKYDADLLAANKENGYVSFENPGSGTTNGSYWNATVVVSGDGFEANGIIFENSFNQYISKKESEDVLVLKSDNKGGERSKTVGDTSVQNKKYVERAAALAFLGDKNVFTNCRFVGRQDTLYGNKNIRALFDRCAIMGGTDYIFGGMIAVFNECKLVFNTMEDPNDVGYITAAQQDGGRGYLMYNCTVTSTTPGVDTASEERSKAGYFGRPWKGGTSETVFINTTVEINKSNTSLIVPEGWSSSLGGEAPVYEYNTKELSGEDNSSKRVSWSTLLTEEEAAKYTPDYFLNGNDGWSPLENREPIPKENTLFLIGDSTVCDYPDDTANYRVVRNGYGMKIGNYLSDDIKVRNLAISGRSTKDFVTYKNEDGTVNYEILLDEMKSGDYLIIGFGHNDEKDTNADRYSPANEGIEVEGSFQYNLYNYYIKPALNRGVIPILATPIVRRGTGSTLTGDKIHQTKNGDYSQAIRDLAEQYNIALIDNTAMTNEHFNKIGAERYGKLHAEYNDEYMTKKGYVNADGTFNESKRIDNTHLNAEGADLVAGFIINALSQTRCSLKNYIRAEERTLFLIGDSTVCDYPNDTANYRVVRNGYGMKIGDYLNSNIKVRNLAISGRSTKDFVTYKNEDGTVNYEILLDEMKIGDYLIIGFGHNDEKDSNTDRYSPANQGIEVEGSFQYNLYNYYIRPALEKGVTPILATPIVRRGTSSTLTGDKIHQTKNGDYSQAIRDLAEKYNITLIDNTAMTNEYFEKVGASEYGKLHAQYNDTYMTNKKYVNEDGTFDETKRIDNTHLNAYGADVVAHLIANALSKTDCSLKNYLNANINKEPVFFVDNLGDVDGNGVITAADSASVLQYVLNLETRNENIKEIADVDANHAINANDAAYILSKVLNNEFKFVYEAYFEAI